MKDLGVEFSPPGNDTPCVSRCNQTVLANVILQFFLKMLCCLENVTPKVPDVAVSV